MDACGRVIHPPSSDTDVGVRRARDTMRSWRRRYPPWVVAPVVVAFAGWCAFAGYLVAQARAGPVLIWNDSLVYASMAHHSLWSRALWVGPRPPVTSLLIKAVGLLGGLRHHPGGDRSLGLGRPGLDGGLPGGPGLETGDRRRSPSSPSPRPSRSPCGTARSSPNPCPSACWRWSSPASSGRPGDRRGPASPPPPWRAWASPPPGTPRYGRWACSPWPPASSP